MKHLIATRLWFDNIKILDKYLDVSLQTFIPQLKKQTCKNFKFGILCKKEHVEHIRQRIGIDFIPFTGGIEQFREEALKGDYKIQTRHDIDDWMREDYIEQIQKIYLAKKDNYDKFIIHAQPIMVEYPSGKEIKIAPYHDRRISMFATLCQRTPDMPIYKGSHGQLWKYVQRVFELPKGYVKWIQHENTVTNARKRKAGLKKVGNMELYDTDHNWISERNIEPVVNILTRTYKRPVSFKVCRESITEQTYRNINHIVGSEEKCDYCPDALKLKKKEGQFLPWNLHLNDLAKKIKTGWVMYLDDDDRLLHKDAIQEIVEEIDNEDQLLLWRVKIGEQTVPNDKYFRKEIRAGQISGIGFLFHSKHLPVPWEARRMGDYHVIEYLSKKLQVKWVDKHHTGTQGAKNNHGKTPPVERPQEKKQAPSVKKISTNGKLVTIGTPTWNNNNILWLSLESLCRQETTVPWELIIAECPGPLEAGEDYIKKYKNRLKKAGCKRILYIDTGTKLDLSTKWIEIIKRARGGILILHDSDDYTHPTRIQATVEKIGDKPWYDTRYAWHYSIDAKALIQYDYWITANRWKTGFNIAIKTDKFRNIRDPHINQGIHKWLSEYVDDKIMDETVYPCVATTGINTVSLNRRRYFKKPIPPFIATDKTIYNIGIPPDIVKKLVDIKDRPALEIHRSKPKVEVEFIKPYLNFWKAGDIKRIPAESYWNLARQGYVKETREAIYEQKIIQIL